MTGESLWYVAYGSNLDQRLLLRHLPTPPTESVWAWCDHPLWFGGRSVRWPGGVAFLGLAPTGPPSRVRAYATDAAGLGAVCESENRQPGCWPGLPDLSPGEFWRTGFPLSDGGATGKYDAVLRLPDLRGRPAYTVTTAHRLEPRAPAAAYRDAIENALSQDLGAEPAREYVEQRAGLSRR